MEHLHSTPQGNGAVDGKGIAFRYGYDGGAAKALDGVDIHIHTGELVAVLGQNGSGKSTLVKHFNALLPLQEGELKVAGMDAGKEDDLWRLRRTCGMVFQNPDNQFVSSIVEEDVAFGLENYGTPEEDLPRQVRRALEQAGMAGSERRAIHSLSGGEKQRVALAGVLAMEPCVLVLDEVTAMLDPHGRREVLERIAQLHRERKRTIVLISHYVEEAVFADRVYLMREGRVLASGAPEEILTDLELLERAGLTPPLPVRIYYDLRKAGILLEKCPLTEEALVEALCRLR